MQEESESIASLSTRSSEQDSEIEEERLISWRLIIQNIMTPIRVLQERSRRKLPWVLKKVVVLGLSLISPLYIGFTLSGLLVWVLSIQGLIIWRALMDDVFTVLRARQLRDLLFAFTLHKFLRFSNAMIKFVLLLAFLLVLFFWLVITSPIWVTLLIWNIPTFILLYILINYTSCGHKLYLKFYDWLAYRSEKPRHALWQMFYSFTCWLYPGTFWRAMNYGYAVLSSNGKLVDMDEDDEYERFPLQLYHFACLKMGSMSNLHHKSILEIGSGRGGGLSYLTRIAKPDRALGVDFSGTQVEFCNQVHREIDNLEFIEGDATRIQALFPRVQTESFDYVLNVESSHCYPNVEAFFEGVFWALKPNGRFFFTDFRAVEEIGALEKSLMSSGFEIQKKENITPNVLQALKLDHERRISMINNHVHCALRALFKKFSGIEGSRIFQEFQQEKCVYFAYTLRKSD